MYITKYIFAHFGWADKKKSIFWQLFRVHKEKLMSRTIQSQNSPAEKKKQTHTQNISLLHFYFFFN